MDDDVKMGSAGAGISPSDMFNFYLSQEQNNVLESIRALEIRKEKNLDPRPARVYLNVCLKILILRMDPLLRDSGKNRDELLGRIHNLKEDGVIEFYNELAKIISRKTNKRTIL